MPNTDLKDLIVGLMALISVAIGIGQYGKLEHFAKERAVEALRPWPSRPFFPAGYDVMAKHSVKTSTANHRTINRR